MVRAVASFSLLLATGQNYAVASNDADVDDSVDMEVTMLQFKTQVSRKKDDVQLDPHVIQTAYDDIKDFVMLNGYDEDVLDRVAPVVALWDEPGDRRQAALFFLKIEEENAELAKVQSFLNTNSSTTYFAESDSVGMIAGGTFLGPLHNTQCQNGQVSRTGGGDANSCAQSCQGSCMAFTVNNGQCIFYDACHGTREEGGTLMYVKNAEGIQPHLLPTRQVSAAEGSTFFVTGDWGGATSPNRQSMHYVHQDPPGSDRWNFHHFAQDNVGRRMGEVGAQSNPFMVVNAGDNFYWGGVTHWTRGGRGIHDSVWQVGFENMYTHPSLNVPWLGILGNHDYGGVGCFADMQAQFNYMAKDMLSNNRWKMPSPYYRHKVDFNGGFSLEVFMIDTNIEDAPFGARGGGVCQQRLCGGRTADANECVAWFRNMEGTQRQWLNDALQDSTAKWKIVVAHHKPDSYAHWIRDVLAQHNVQMMVGSHTHEMAFFDVYNTIGKPLLVVGAGGGAQANPGCAGATYCGGVYGFAEVEVHANQMEIKIHTVNNDNPLHHYICEDGTSQGNPC